MGRVECGESGEDRKEKERKKAKGIIYYRVG
jgi:hypothetical protein